MPESEKHIGEIQVPEWFVEGLNFRSQHFKGLVTVLSFNATTNLLHVKIDPQQEDRTAWEEDGWNLQHTLWGFERGEYVINKNVKWIGGFKFKTKTTSGELARIGIYILEGDDGQVIKIQKTVLSTREQSYLVGNFKMLKKFNGKSLYVQEINLRKDSFEIIISGLHHHFNFFNSPTHQNSKP